MNRARVYVWTPDASRLLGGMASLQIMDIKRLETSEVPGLLGRYAHVLNDGELVEPDLVSGIPVIVGMGDAPRDANGDFLFQHSRGGPRLDRPRVESPARRLRGRESSYFGQVNCYYHIDLVSHHVDGILRELGMPSLPRVVVRVHAHHAAVERSGVRDGQWRSSGWLPFQGGHYRLPARSCDIHEHHDLSPHGEIHLGPGWRHTAHGAFFELTGRKYRCNAAHNPGILYHEYGHHLTRHTADFRANRLRDPARQNNRKTDLDEAVCDYLAATVLNTPHIWAFHHQHDQHVIHSRSLASRLTMVHFDPTTGSDPHANGTIFAGALWDIRTEIAKSESARVMDILVVKMLDILGKLTPGPGATIEQIRESRKSFSTGLEAILAADAELFSGSHQPIITEIFALRGIYPGTHAALALDAAPMVQLASRFAGMELPRDDELLHSDAAEHVAKTCDPFDLLVGGDVMLGDRTRLAVRQHGRDYPLAALAPFFARSRAVLVNLEGPFARRARKERRVYAYRVNPMFAPVLRRAGITHAALANNHLLDCGPEGVLETLQVLREAGIVSVGAGKDQFEAHMPHIVNCGNRRIGILNYYWNRRTGAGRDSPGAARDLPERYPLDIATLRERADYVVVSCHWGNTYECRADPADVVKARQFIDEGADVVIGHHPHVLQAAEIYRGRPIFYSVGNLAFGSGNSRAEGILVGLNCGETHLRVRVLPLYVKNRDPRCNYQPKLLIGAAARRQLHRLMDLSGEYANRFEEVCGTLELMLPAPEGGRHVAPV